MYANHPKQIETYIESGFTFIYTEEIVKNENNGFAGLSFLKPEVITHHVFYANYFYTLAKMTFHFPPDKKQCLIYAGAKMSECVC